MSYGLLTAKDIETIEKTLDLVCESNYNDPVRVTEIGVRDGSTSRGINKYLVKKGKLVFYTGIDNNHDMEVQEPFDGCYLIIGNSGEVFYKLQDNSQNFIFLDANHSLFNTTADFLLYMSKVRVNGFFVFHDTSPNIAPFTDYQGIGDKNNTYNYISCRDAIQRMGLLENKFPGWELVYDEHDQSFPTGGVTVVKRIS
jgi:hypothetical protein